jgi:DNA-binding transcriptional LysR family regulator
MLDLNDFNLFVQVVDRGSLTAAGTAMHMPKSTVSYRIQQLETEVGTRLLHRTSRHVRMTDVGNAFYAQAVMMLQHARQAEAIVREHLTEPMGRLRFTTAITTAQFAMRPLLPRFMAAFPKVDIIQVATDALVDIVGENFDVAIRAHSTPLPDSALVQRALAPVPWMLFASPGYLAMHGSPESPDDLLRHRAVAMLRGGDSPSWKLTHPHAGSVAVSITPRFASNDMLALKEAVIDGHGIAALPGYVCREETVSGRMVRVLPEWLAGQAMLTALVPERHGMLPSVRAFLDFVAQHLPSVVAL